MILIGGVFLIFCDIVVKVVLIVVLVRLVKVWLICWMLVMLRILVIRIWKSLWCCIVWIVLIVFLMLWWCCVIVFICWVRFFWFNGVRLLLMSIWMVFGVWVSMLMVYCDVDNIIVNCWVIVFLLCRVLRYYGDFFSVLDIWWKVSNLWLGLGLLVSYVSIVGMSVVWICIVWLVLLVSVLIWCSLVFLLWNFSVFRCIFVVFVFICRFWVGMCVIVLIIGE